MGMMQVMDDDFVSEAVEYKIFESENKLEPRYLDSWQQKNWLLTGDIQP
jgi:hypothetical protein